jgi:hypothetical protein
MATSTIQGREEEKGGNKMENKQGFARIWSGIGWGLFIILAAVLILAKNQGWVEEGAGWLYFVIGVGVLFITGFLVRFFGLKEGWNAVGDLAMGVAMVYFGAVCFYGYGDWWPLVVVPFGLGWIVKSLQHGKRETAAH